jgi:hypothetical protein
MIFLKVHGVNILKKLKHGGMGAWGHGIIKKKLQTGYNF